MKKCFKEFQYKKEKRLIKIINSRFNKVIYDFSYFLINSDDNTIIQEINQKILKNKFMIISNCKLSNTQYFIICFDDICNIINIDEINLLRPFLINNKNCEIVTTEKSSSILSKKLENVEEKLTFLIEDDNLKTEIENMLNSFLTLKPQPFFWQIIQRSISSYLIIKSYYNSRIDRVINYKLYFKKLRHRN